MACYYCDRSPCVCTPSMFDDVPRPLPSEMAIRADERARVVAIVDAHLSDLRTAHTASVREASPHWVKTIENIIDSMTVLRGRIADHAKGAG